MIWTIKMDWNVRTKCGYENENESKWKWLIMSRNIRISEVVKVKVIVIVESLRCWITSTGV